MGFLLLIIAGVFQGSFGLGYKRYTPFSWAAFWGIYNLLCIVITVSFSWTMLSNIQIITQIYSWFSVFCGALWGMSAICFSKAIDKIGMSMVYGISMGISTITGSVLPMIMNASLPYGQKAVMLSIGLLLSVMGIILITIAGVRRDGGLKSSFGGVIMAILSGLGSGAMNTGFACSDEIGQTLIQSGFSQISISAVKWLPVLTGGCVMCVIWCIGELTVKQEWNSIVQKGAVVRTGKLFGVSIIWYAALLIYGLSSSILQDKIGEMSWALFNALALLVSTAWGLKTGEWKNTSKKILFSGCLLLIISWLFIAL